MDQAQMFWGCMNEKKATISPRYSDQGKSKGLLRDSSAVTLG